MNTASILYLENLRSQATHNQSGSHIMIDAPTDNQGLGEAFSPTDLVATALGACMLTIMGIAAKTHQIDMAGTKVEVEKIMGSTPRRIAQINITISLPPNGYTDRQKQILEVAARGCPVTKSLHPDLVQNVVFVY